MGETAKQRAVKQATRFVAEVDAAELAVRLIERGIKLQRPPGVSGAEAWKDFEQAAADGRIPAYIVRDFEAMAQIAITYFGQCIARLQRPN